MLDGGRAGIRIEYDGGRRGDDGGHVVPDVRRREHALLGERLAQFDREVGLV